MVGQPRRERLAFRNGKLKENGMFNWLSIFKPLIDYGTLNPILIQPESSTHACQCASHWPRFNADKIFFSAQALSHIRGFLEYHFSFTFRQPSILARK